MSEAAQPAVSVVVPFFEEQDAVAPFFAELLAVLDALPDSAEVVAVDDGSRDATFARLEEVRQGDERVCLVRFRRNFGQSAALAAGFEYARGTTIVTLDGDLQNDPAEIPRLLAALAAGADVVSGWRRDRHDAFVTRILPSRIANSIISRVTGLRLHDFGCGLKAYRAEITKGIRLYGEMHRFLPALAADLGAAVVEIPVRHRARTTGRSKYGLSRGLRVLLDLLTVRFLSGYATRPIHFFGLFGLPAFLGGTLLLGWLGFERIFLGVELGGRPIVLLAIFLATTGLQFLTFGLLAEMMARTWHESQGKAVYLVRDLRGLR
ncbi:MAG: glycosyltransferase family 2 protein [Deltaproteobacteria bacterium]